MSKILIEFNEVYKQYQDNFLSLNNINLKIIEGDIHALVGDNGAGKTTCIKLLAKLISPTSGVIKVANKRLFSFNTSKHRISYAGQDSYFILDFSVRQNIVLGNEPNFLKIFINWKKIDVILEKLMNKYKIFVNLSQKFDSLSLSEQRKVSLLRALYQKPKILLLDEPTVGLPLEQEKEFLPIFRSFIEDKITVVFSTRSHTFAKAVSNKYSILKNGKIIITKINNNLFTTNYKLQYKNWTQIINYVKPKVKNQKLKLYIEDMSINKRNSPFLEEFDLTLREKEILGVYDSLNVSSSLIADLIIGKVNSSKMRIFFENNNISNKSQKQRHNLGIDIVPENFLQDSLLFNHSLLDNFILWHHDKSKYLYAGVLKYNDIKYHLKKIFQEYELPDFVTPNTITNTLSNGELQKFVLARTLESDAKLIVLVNPLMHLDNASAKLIINKIINLKNKGVAFILIDCDPYLLELLCDRVSIIQNGRLSITLEYKDIKTEFLNNPLKIIKKTNKILNKHIQITKSELEYDYTSHKKIIWLKFITNIRLFKDRISLIIEKIRSRITGG